jgi:hypothetical protein
VVATTPMPYRIERGRSIELASGKQRVGTETSPIR